MYTLLKTESSLIEMKDKIQRPRFIQMDSNPLSLKYFQRHFSFLFNCFLSKIFIFILISRNRQFSPSITWCFPHRNFLVQYESRETFFSLKHFVNLKKTFSFIFFWSIPFLNQIEKFTSSKTTDNFSITLTLNKTRFLWTVYSSIIDSFIFQKIRKRSNNYTILFLSVELEFFSEINSILSNSKVIRATKIFIHHKVDDGLNSQS